MPTLTMDRAGEVNHIVRVLIGRYLPNATANNSREAIWLSPLRANCSIVLLSGAISAYSIVAPSMQTAATLGGVLLASTSNCTGFPLSSFQTRTFINNNKCLLVCMKADACLPHSSSCLRHHATIAVPALALLPFFLVYVIFA